MSTNTLIHRIVRPAVRAVARTRVTPNQVTALRFATGVAAALAFAVGGTLWPAIGGAVFVVSMLLDRADGELARQTGRSSLAGYRYDTVSDGASNALAMFGIGVGLADVSGDAGPLLGAVAGTGIGVLFWQIFALKLARPQGYELRSGIVLDPDDALLLVPVLVWCGAAFPMLVAAALVTPSAALWLGLRRRPYTRNT